MKGLAGVLGVLLVLAGLFSSLVLPGLIEDQLARRLQVGLGLPTEPDVEVSSSFPPELLLIPCRPLVGQGFGRRGERSPCSVGSSRVPSAMTSKTG